MTSNIDHYPPIGRLTAVGDGYSLALLGPDAAVEWWCPLRFDADPFAAVRLAPVVGDEVDTYGELLRPSPTSA